MWKDLLYGVFVLVVILFSIAMGFIVAAMMHGMFVQGYYLLIIVILVIWFFFIKLTSGNAIHFLTKWDKTNCEMAAMVSSVFGMGIYSGLILIGIFF